MDFFSFTEREIFNSLHILSNRIVLYPSAHKFKVNADIFSYNQHTINYFYSGFLNTPTTLIQMPTRNVGP
jgi:hypothetical protein